MTDTVEQAQSEVAAAEAQPVVEAPEPTSEVESPEVIAARRLADGTARPDGREPSTIPDERAESQDA